MVRARAQGPVVEPLASLTLRVLDGLTDVPREAWDALLRPHASPFVEHTWLSCLEESGCVGERTGWLPRHLALFEGEELVAAAPAYVKGNSEGEFVFDWSWADLAARLGIDYYPKLLLAVPFTPATGDRVLVRPDRDRRETIAVFASAVKTLVKELGLSSAHVNFPHEEEARIWTTDGGFMLRHGVQYHWHNQAPPFASYEAFLATLPQKKRTQIRRERKQPAMDGVVIRTLEKHEYTRERAHTMYELYTTTVDKYFYGRRYLRRPFFELVAERFSDRLSWVVAERNGETIASAFNIAKDGVLYGRYWGAHVDLPFLHFNVCYYHGVDEAIREGFTRFNPGAGGEHKRVRGFRPTMTFSAHHVAHPKLHAILDAHLARERSAIADYIAKGGDDE
ncbi:MAG: N-acetyltransferase [Deltaproteobacteria bacterium]|nr:N-acetyltransferase [Deltaproteobacteria bacterium]